MKRIIVKNLSKKFNLGFRRNTTLFNVLSLLNKKKEKKIIHALKNVSFEANSGEIIGIIGANKSGKSTLLRTIAGIYHADSGKVETCGKIVPLINLNIGMHDRLTLKDNVYLCGSFFGLSKKEIKSKFEEIVKFAELEEFINEQIYKFSEGMKQRLVLSIAMYSNPEILLLDEVFEVGDQNFKKRCSQKIIELVKKGICVLLSTHDYNLIKKYCNYAIWLEKGRIMLKDKPEKVVKAYLNSCRKKEK